MDSRSLSLAGISSSSLARSSFSLSVCISMNLEISLKSCGSILTSESSFLRVAMVDWYGAFFWSSSWIRDDNAPVAYEKAITPRIMVTMLRILSGVFFADMSPYPTVVIVVTEKYMASQYISPSSMS